jgi:hypothetical protein
MLQDFIKAFKSHPTWHTEVASLLPGSARAFHRTLKYAEEKMEDMKEAAGGTMVDKIDELKTLVQEWEAEEDEDDFMIKLPPLREIVMEVTGGEPGRMGEALIAFFEAL